MFVCSRVEYRPKAFLEEQPALPNNVWKCCPGGLTTEGKLDHTRWVFTGDWSLRFYSIKGGFPRRFLQLSFKSHVNMQTVQPNQSLPVASTCWPTWPFISPALGNAPHPVGRPVTHTYAWIIPPVRWAFWIHSACAAHIVGGKKTKSAAHKVDGKVGHRHCRGIDKMRDAGETKDGALERLKKLSASPKLG